MYSFPDCPGVKTAISIDRLRYWVDPSHLKRIQNLMGPLLAIARKKGRFIFTHRPSFLGKVVHISFSREKPFAKILIDVDDPTESEQKALLRLFGQNLPQRSFGQSEVEIALDAKPERPEGLMLLKRAICAHLFLAYARKEMRWNTGKRHPLLGTLYVGSYRGGPRSVKVYNKRLGADSHSDVIRIEWTIHQRFEAYGMPRIGVIRLDGIRFDKLVQWRRVDYHRMAELAYRRWPKRETSMAEFSASVRVTHWSRPLQAVLEPNMGTDHIQVLMDIVHRYRHSAWYRRQDLDRVFPRLDA